MRPAEPLSQNRRGVGIDLAQWDMQTARMVLAGGNRQERRAAARWIKRHAETQQSNERGRK